LSPGDVPLFSNGTGPFLDVITLEGLLARVRRRDGVNSYSTVLVVASNVIPASSIVLRAIYRTAGFNRQPRSSVKPHPLAIPVHLCIASIVITCKLTFKSRSTTKLSKWFSKVLCYFFLHTPSTRDSCSFSLLK
jgi:hypothetical protein